MAQESKIITIIGLMGVGKSTVGLKMAEKIGYYFVDSDQEVEDQQKASISEIFKAKGEEYFRATEKKIIKDIVDRDERIVLSLGGGAFDDDETREMLLKKSHVIWLKAPIDVILHRIGGKTNRPLLNKGDKRKTLQSLIDKRYPFYRLANIEIDTSKSSHEEIIATILKKK